MHDDVWRAIRALRATPPVSPGLGAQDKRCDTFRAAVRQAEELADAAAAVGYTTRALPLFYAVEQVGLAIAAAKSQQRLSATSHGLKFNRDYREKNVLLGQIVPDGKDGAFQAAADVTASPRLAGTAALGELWAANPDLVDVPIPANLGSWNRPLIGELGARPDLTAVGGHEDPRVAPITTGGSVKFATEAPGETVGEVAALLAPYPSLWDVEAFAEIPNAGADFGQPADRVYRHDGQHRGSRVMLGRRAPGSLSHTQHWRLQDALFSFVEIDDRQPAAPHPSWIGYALPRVAGGNSPSPLMLWWALLLGFSSLVRYHPAPWTRALDFDKGPLAVHLHQVLDVAVERVPRRLLAALTR